MKRIWEAIETYMERKQPLIIIAGANYGQGSSRDWAAKGVHLAGVEAIAAEGFERIHRTNLIGMGVLPLEFKPGVNRLTLGLDGTETYDVTGARDAAGGADAGCAPAGRVFGGGAWSRAGWILRRRCRSTKPVGVLQRFAQDFLEAEGAHGAAGGVAVSTCVTAGPGPAVTGFDEGRAIPDRMRLEPRATALVQPATRVRARPGLPVGPGKKVPVLEGIAQSSLRMIRPDYPMRGLSRSRRRIVTAAPARPSGPRDKPATEQDRPRRVQAPDCQAAEPVCGGCSRLDNLALEPASACPAP